MVDSTNLPEVDINQIATDLNGKMDRDGVNASCPTLLSRTANSYNGVVEIWSDGYCVQTGELTTVNQDSTTVVNLTKSYANGNYIVTVTATGGSRNNNQCTNGNSVSVRNTDSFTIFTYDYNYSRMWRTEGYIR